MKRTQAGLRGEGSFRKNKNGFTAAQSFLNLLRLLQPLLRILAAKRKMAELAKKRSEKRHGHHFGFGDEMIIRAESRHEHNYIRVAGVICNQHMWLILAEMLAPFDAYAPSRNFHVHAQRCSRDSRRTFSRC